MLIGPPTWSLGVIGSSTWSMGFIGSSPLKISSKSFVYKFKFLFRLIGLIDELPYYFYSYVIISFDFSSSLYFK